MSTIGMSLSLLPQASLTGTSAGTTAKNGKLSAAQLAEIQEMLQATSSNTSNAMPVAGTGIDANTGSSSNTGSGSGTNPTSSAVSPQTAFYAQTIGQAASDAPAASDDAAGESAADAFMQFAKEDPMQRLRDQILQSMGLTEQEVQNMSPAEQAKVEAAVKQKIEEALKKNMTASEASSVSAAAPQDTATEGLLASI